MLFPLIVPRIAVPKVPPEYEVNTTQTLPPPDVAFV